MFCSYCGTNLPDDGVFCNKCGKRQQGATEGVTISDSASPETSKGGEQLPVEYMPTAQATLQTNILPTEKSNSQNTPPFASLVSSPILKQNAGTLIAGIGGILALLAFFFLPYLSLGFFGSLTGSQLASANNGLIQGTGALWLEPLVAAAVIGIAVYLIFKSQKNELNEQVARGLSVSLMGAATVTLVVLFIKYTIDAQPPTSVSASGYSGPTLASFYGAGMWIYFIAMLAVLAGGIVQVRLLSSKQK